MWHELLRAFIGVKELHICAALSEELSRALQVEEARSDPGLLPGLQKLVTELEWKHTDNPFGSFVDARRITHHLTHSDGDCQCHHHPAWNRLNRGIHRPNCPLAKRREGKLVVPPSHDLAAAEETIKDTTPQHEDHYRRGMGMLRGLEDVVQNEAVPPRARSLEGGPWGLVGGWMILGDVGEDDWCWGQGMSRLLTEADGDDERVEGGVSSWGCEQVEMGGKRAQQWKNCSPQGAPRRPLHREMVGGGTRSRRDGETTVVQARIVVRDYGDRIAPKADLRDREIKPFGEASGLGSVTSWGFGVSFPKYKSEV
ncbi:hypothetical protein EDB84DRAFT_1445070 [Lactarius hengduanensis]|nr:hypothetical protein EDB84DRAFT_1445070 [Lactarius hengduanensis]